MSLKDIIATFLKNRKLKDFEELEKTLGDLIESYRKKIILIDTYLQEKVVESEFRKQFLETLNVELILSSLEETYSHDPAIKADVQQLKKNVQDQTLLASQTKINFDILRVKVKEEYNLISLEQEEIKRIEERLFKQQPQGLGVSTPDVQEYDSERLKLENLITTIESKMPNQKFDFFSATFWDDLVNVIDTLFGKEQKISYISAVSKYHSSYNELEFWGRLIARHSYDYLVQKGTLTENDKQVYMQAMPDFWADMIGYDANVRNVNAEVLKEICKRLRTAFNELRKHSNAKKIGRGLSDFCKLHRVVIATALDQNLSNYAISNEEKMVLTINLNLLAIAKSFDRQYERLNLGHQFTKVPHHLMKVAVAIWGTQDSFLIKWEKRKATQ